MVAVKGFAGLRVTGEGLSLDPRLPARWQKLRFSVFWHGLRFAVLIAPGEVCIEADPDNSGEAVWRICGVPAKCGPGGRITRPIAAGMS